MAGLLGNKLGPLPTWGWLGIATAGFGAYYLYERHKNGGGSPAGTSGTAQVPDYVFQNYNEQPPEGPEPKQPDHDDHHRHKPKPKPKPKHHHHHHRREREEEKHETAFVQHRERHVGEYGSPAYRHKYGKTWREQRAPRRRRRGK